MKWFSKPELLPAHAKNQLLGGEHLLAWSYHQAGILIITDQGIIDVLESNSLRYPWNQVLSATWAEPNLVVNCTAVDGAPFSKTWLLNEPGLVPVAVRDRVTASLLIDKLIEVDEVGPVRFIAHRSNQGVLWTTITDESVALHSEPARSRIAQALANLRSTLGV